MDRYIGATGFYICGDLYICICKGESKWSRFRAFVIVRFVFCVLWNYQRIFLARHDFFILFLKNDLTVTDDTVLEEHNEDPSLVQMRLIGDGVVDSIMRGEVVGITPRRSRSSAVLTQHQQHSFSFLFVFIYWILLIFVHLEKC
ncbi:hypothetical protein Phum_PHUM511940 [Pediculus humanus corporis]|uniref:Lysine-specific demethylase 3A/B tudor domain-containing protein n=1 Tax=Pediculus humanus subsp. corporis TaxID=121224 RepID=E0VY95_PEDHC|nr:uncharacterized protein Phum_PHUM511940 [Pediculus humanus corporis]EEB18351.1 hypothetical protein Phum_PHUM511940 [Pediculus humanus corporis]